MTTTTRDRGQLLRHYRTVRAQTQQLCQPLSAEDAQVQSMPDASPTKWHLAHTTWFFETFVLTPHCQNYTPFHPHFGYLFNSYYNAIGERVPRPSRGLITRPTLEEVFAYRHAIDTLLLHLLEEANETLLTEVAPLVELGVNHEQQHQELILTDIKHTLATNPLRPAYRARRMDTGASAAALDWVAFPAGVGWVGHAGAGFAYDNESPHHRVFVEGFHLATRLVTSGDWLAFMADGGYQRPELWMSDGWTACLNEGWRAPLYWETLDGAWWQYTLDGMRPVDTAEPVCHVSWYEADAYARWASARLPTESEWETAAVTVPLAGNLLETDRLHPAPASDNGLSQLFGDVWEWTASPHVAYPGYRPPPGALGEYNGKFMCNQMVLRGGSCATPGSHLRASYRNFFPPNARWQFSGVRLAKDA